MLCSSSILRRCWRRTWSSCQFIHLLVVVLLGTSKTLLGLWVSTMSKELFRFVKKISFQVDLMGSLLLVVHCFWVISRKASLLDHTTNPLFQQEVDPFWISSRNMEDMMYVATSNFQWMRLLLQVSFSSVVVKYLNHIKFLIWIISCTSPYCIILYDPEPFKYCFAEEDTKELAIMT